MKLVLLAGSQPRAQLVGPRVRLFAGRWKLCVGGLQDTEMCVTCPTEFTIALTVKDGVEFVLTRGAEVYATILRGGKESHLTLFAEHQNGSNASTN